MFQEVTKGIKISVQTSYNGAVYRGHTIYFSFSYFISIENNSNDIVQLKERFWKIFDSLNNIESVSGEGVVGRTPIIEPNGSYAYKSNCFLSSTIGAMSGKYKMINIDSEDTFFVTVPTFQLTTTPTLN